MNTPIRARASLARLVVAAACGLAASASGASAATFDRGAIVPDSPANAASPAPDNATAGPLRLVVNIPAYRLDAFLGDRLVATYDVTVGKSREPTPDGRFTIDTIIWNPWWHPPANRRPKDKVTPPGPRNPMGRVKLNLHDLYYIHGTAKEEEIGRPLSRGCVRMRNEDALALARLVHQHAGLAVTPQELGRLEANPRATRHVKVPNPVAVEIVYRVVEVRDGDLQVHPDVYRQESRPLDDLALQALAQAGIDAGRVDATLLAAALGDSGTVKEALSVPVQSVLVAAERDAELAGGTATTAAATLAVTAGRGGAAPQ